MNHVPGEFKGNIKVYAESSCEWCKKTMRLLKELGVDFWYIYIDQVLEEDERKEVLDDLKIYNPACTFPTVLIDRECIVGYDEQKLKDKLGKGKTSS